MGNPPSGSIDFPLKARFPERIFRGYFKVISRLLATIVVASLLLSASATVHPSIAATDGLQKCASISSTEERLACYDELAEAQVAPSIVPSASKWTVSVKTSPIDDSKNVILYVVGEKGITNQYGRRSDLSLWIACRENVTAAWLNFGGYFMSDLQGRGAVTYRVDSLPAQEKRFTESTDHQALGLWNGGNAIPWIKSLFGGKRMYVEATPFSDSAVSDFLPILGLEEAITPLRESCGW